MKKVSSQTPDLQQIISPLDSV